MSLKKEREREFFLLSISLIIKIYMLIKTNLIPTKKKTKKNNLLFQFILEISTIIKGKTQKNIAKIYL